MRSARSVSPYWRVVCFWALLNGWAGQVYSQSLEQEKPTKTVVTYQTEDGLTLYATLHLPKAARSPVAGVVLFAEPGWIVRSTFDGSNIAGDLARIHGMAALTVDFRGTANNVHGRLYDLFSPREREKLQMDVRGAVKYLSSQKGVDASRIGIVAVGKGADYALLEASEDSAVQALVLISGSLSDGSREYIKSRRDIPILCLAGRDDKEGFLEMAKAFALSENRDSDFVLGASGHGTGMFTRTKGLSEQVAAWLAANLKGLGIQTEIAFKTPDGWSLRGRLGIPEGLAPGAKVPGVVFIHGANHDQDTYYDLSRAIMKKGIATLTFDWRGKNRDINEGKGHYAVDLPAEDRDKIYLDVKTAINFMASQDAVDANRIGLVAATAPTTDTLKAAIGDNRIRTIVMLSQYQLNDDARKYLATSDTPIFFVASVEDVNVSIGSLAEFTKEAHRLSKNKDTELLLYDDAGRGTEMMKTKPELEGMIVRWITDKLASK